ncbi:Uncharacterized protein HZ326_31865, partial [Fusarium oxysporum f. sp. albedinis]
MDRDTLL